MCLLFLNGAIAPIGNSQLPEMATWIWVLYIGPETILPLTSFIAAIVGFLLMFWRWVVGSCKRVMHWCSRTVKRLFGMKVDVEVGEGEGKETVSELPSEKSEKVIDSKP